MTMELWPFIPQQGLTESFEWETDVQRCRSAEYRRAIRPFPRHDFMFSNQLTPEQFGRAKAIAKSVGGTPLRMPIWTEMTELGSVSIGVSALPVSTYGLNYTNGLLLIWQSDSHYDIHTISGMSSNTIYLSDPIRSYFASPLVMPLRTVVFAQSLEVARKPDDVIEARVRFTATLTEDGGGMVGKSYPTYRGYPVVTDIPEVIDDVREEFLRQTEDFDTISGNIYRLPIYSAPEQTSVLAWTALDRLELINLRYWVYSQKGRQKAFWLPSWSRDVTVTHDIAPTDTHIEIIDVNYRNLTVGTHGVSFDLGIITTSGVMTRVHVIAVEAGSSGKEVLTLSAAANATIPAASIDRVCRLTLSRFNTDRVEMQHRAGGETTVVVPVVEVPV
jgi:hypothetical protein